MRYLAILIIIFTHSVNAEIEYVTTTENCPHEKCTYIWPKLARVAGWAQDLESSFKYKSNIIIPVGEQYSSTPVAIASIAIPKDDSRSLNDFINSTNDWPDDDEVAKVKEKKSLKSKNGLLLRTYYVESENSAPYKLYAYIEEGGYFVQLSLIGWDERIFKINESTFKKVVEAYTVKP